jgi:tRNA (guanosine-2'-O-)-methyltransferase
VRAQGYRLLVAVPGATLAVGDLDPLVPTALAFGNEHLGITPALRDAADGAFAIPMHGCSQSFNVSVSVAVALHVLTEARRRALGKGGDLDERGRFALRARYYARDLRGAEEIVQRYLARRP